MNRWHPGCAILLGVVLGLPAGAGAAVLGLCWQKIEQLEERAALLEWGDGAHHVTKAQILGEMEFCNAGQEQRIDRLAGRVLRLEER